MTLKELWDSIKEQPHPDKLFVDFGDYVLKGEQNHPDWEKPIYSDFDKVLVNHETKEIILK